MKTRYYVVAGLMVLAAAAAFAWMLPQLPGRVPTHWNVHGEPDRHGSPWSLFVAGPVLMAGAIALFAIMPWLSPKRFGVDAFERTYLHFMLIVVAMPGYIFAVALWAAAGGSPGVLRAVVGGVCVMAILVGNLLGKVRRNFFIGIRTPWTLASERVWYATHRFAAKVLVGTGLVALGALALGAPPWASIVLVGGGFLAPVLHSLVHYKRLQGKGEIDAAL